MNEQKSKHEPSLEDIYKLAKDNNRMLRAIRRDAFVGGILKFVFWIAIFFILPYILYVVYLQPYLETIQSTYENLNQSAGTLSSAAKDVEELKNQFPNFADLLKQFTGGQ